MTNINVDVRVQIDDVSFPRVAAKIAKCRAMRTCSLNRQKIKIQGDAVQFTKNSCFTDIHECEQNNVSPRRPQSDSEEVRASSILAAVDVML